MNKLLKRGLNAYKIFLKNKLAMSFMMLFSGVMMFIAALNGHGNDTKTLPITITIAGLVFSLWAFYRIGFIKAGLDKIPREQREERSLERKVLFMQIGEAVAYLIVVALGIFLLTNESFVNKVLNLMAGGFTTFNGALGIVNTYKNRERKDFYWKLIIVLTVFELIIGPYFIFASDNIDTNGFIIMGVLTMVAGLFEVISALTMDTLKNTVQDGKDIVHILKDKE